MEAVTLFVIEGITKTLSSLKAHREYGPWTFIGKHFNYESNRLTDNEQVHHQQRLPIIRKVIDHGDDEEAASRWWHSRNMPVSFGPVYHGLEKEAWKKAKQEAWQYVLRNSDDDDGSGTDQTTQRYIEAITRVEEESKALYVGDSANSSIASLSSDQFIWIMILDGCFFLQIALFVLGGSKQLNYPIVDVEAFGVPPRNYNKLELIRAAISSMFIVGNQIPILVLKELMKQSFFKKIVEQGKWQQPLDLERWVLFDQILVPMLDVKGGDIFIPTAYMNRFWYIKRAFALPPLSSLHFFSSIAGNPSISYMSHGLIEFIEFDMYYYISSLVIFYLKKKKRKPSVIEAYDLLQGLWLVMSGLSPSNKGGDLDHQIISDDKDDIEHNSYDVIHPTVRSATELKEAGISFRCIEGTRIKEILFKQDLFNAFLKLPKIIIGSEMEFLFSNLIQYEVSREDLGQHRRKICGYLQLLRELIRTHDDVKLLAACGIIIVDSNEEEKLPDMLRRLDIPNVNAHRSLSKVRDQLNNYTRASIYKRFGDLVGLVAVLTIIQTVFAILSYIFKK